MMYKKILVCLDRNQFQPFDYHQETEEALKSVGMNSGNNVFEFALQKMLQTPDVQVDVEENFFHRNELFLQKVEQINAEYDAMVLNTANILARWAKRTKLPEWSRALNKIKIPVYVLSLGAQSDSNYSLDFVQDIKKEASTFLRSILNTGGRIAIRGYFTAEVFQKLGFSDSDYTVTGCPSLYLNAGQNKIIKPELSSDKELKPVFNGDRLWFEPVFWPFYEKYPNSVFICQHYFYPLLYRPEDISDKWKDALANGLFIKLLAENRVQMFCDYLPWERYLKNNHFNFSVGGRIHGNVVSLLAGIPACIDAHDSRVREMAEFFNIPYVALKPDTDLYELYGQCDYDAFNNNLFGRFEYFRQWMHECGLPCFENMDYVNQKIEALQIPDPIIVSTPRQLEKINSSKSRKIKSRLYKILHFYWLRGKK